MVSDIDNIPRDVHLHLNGLFEYSDKIYKSQGVKKILDNCKIIYEHCGKGDVYMDKFSLYQEIGDRMAWEVMVLWKKTINNKFPLSVHKLSLVAQKVLKEYDERINCNEK